MLFLKCVVSQMHVAVIYAVRSAREPQKQIEVQSLLCSFIRSARYIFPPKEGFLNKWISRCFGGFSARPFHEMFCGNLSLPGRLLFIKHKEFVGEYFLYNLTGNLQKGKAFRESLHDCSHHFLSLESVLFFDKNIFFSYHTLASKKRKHVSYLATVLGHDLQHLYCCKTPCYFFQEVNKYSGIK